LGTPDMALGHKRLLQHLIYLVSTSVKIGYVIFLTHQTEKRGETDSTPDTVVSALKCKLSTGIDPLVAREPEAPSLSTSSAKSKIMSQLRGSQKQD